GSGKAGEGVVIGVIDTGIYPEHPSFADVPLGPEGRRYGGPAYRPDPPAGWKGTCQAGAGFPAGACNHKLIGARYFVDGFGAANLKPGEFLSPRDANGHGSHVAATAAGNYGVAPKIGGYDLGIPAVSGIAPRARIAAYKVCWTGRAATGEARAGRRAAGRRHRRPRPRGGSRQGGAVPPRLARRRRRGRQGGAVPAGPERPSREGQGRARRRWRRPGPGQHETGGRRRGRPPLG